MIALTLLPALALVTLGLHAKPAVAAASGTFNSFGAATTAKCEPIDLGIHFAGSSVGGPMDLSRFQFINVSHRACHLQGYPGVAAVDAAGRQFTLKVVRENVDNVPLTSVAIAPRGRASFEVESVVPSFQHGRCVTSYNMRFTPPNDYSTLTIRHKLVFCAGGILIGPVQKSGEDANGPGTEVLSPGHAP